MIAPLPPAAEADDVDSIGGGVCTQKITRCPDGGNTSRRHDLVNFIEHWRAAMPFQAIYSRHVHAVLSEIYFHFQWKMC